MGLGKTRQLIIAMTQAEPHAPYLVICPASVKYDWAHEIHLALSEAAVGIVGPDDPPEVGCSGWVSRRRWASGAHLHRSRRKKQHGGTSLAAVDEGVR